MERKLAIYLPKCQSWHVQHEVHFGDDRICWIQLLEIVVVCVDQERQVSNTILMKLIGEQEVSNPHHDQVIFPVWVSFWYEISYYDGENSCHQPHLCS